MYTWQTFYLLSHFLSTYSSISYINTENRCYLLVLQTRTLIDDPVSPSIRVPILSVNITRWKGVRSTSLSRLLMGPSFSRSVSISPGSCFVLFPLIQSRNEEFALSIHREGLGPFLRILIFHTHMAPCIFPAVLICIESSVRGHHCPCLLKCRNLTINKRVNKMPKGPAPGPVLLSFTCLCFYFL